MIEIVYVDTHAHRQVVSATAEHADGKRYRIGHLPGEGWFCLCRSRACSQLAELQSLVPRIPARRDGAR
ncbi:hypothetical protein EV645_3998 [Kribbella rubisoli]|uniref:Uncharacterized protein n=1 Tax=Kribbella rubisoli TaxID=3075929 RepID=A0A4Q7X1Y2_9ACTN|nr:hypothetical protein EV645_3998 [Kribbella rubisoli]